MSAKDEKRFLNGARSDLSDLGPTEIAKSLHKIPALLAPWTRCKRISGGAAWTEVLAPRCPELGGAVGTPPQHTPFTHSPNILPTRPEWGSR